MIPIGTILSVAGSVAKGAMEWLNSAAGNMFKGWLKGRKDQQRIDTIKTLKQTVEKQHDVEQAREHLTRRRVDEFDDWLRGPRDK